MADANVEQFLKGLQRAGEEQKARAAKACDLFALHVLGDAQDRCPVDKGDLKASATDRPAEWHGGTLTKLFGFNRFYAAIVHEVLTAHHPQGEAKYLYLAMADNAPKFGPFVAGYVKGGA